MRYLIAAALALAPAAYGDDDPCWDKWHSYERALSTVEGYKNDIQRELDNVERWGAVKEAGYQAAAREFKNALTDAKKAGKACAKAVGSVNPLTKGYQIIKASVHLTAMMNRLGAVLIGRSGVDLRVGAYQRLQGLQGLLAQAEAEANAAYDSYRACCDGLPSARSGADRVAPPRPPDAGPVTTPGPAGEPQGGATGDAPKNGGQTGGRGTVINPPHKGDGFEVVETTRTGLRVETHCDAGSITEVRSKGATGDWRVRFRGRGSRATLSRTAGEAISVKVRCIAPGGEIREHAELEIPAAKAGETRR